MSCISGLVYKKKVYIGADSLATSDDDIRKMSTRKIFRKEDYIFGVVGMTFPIQIMNSKKLKTSKNVYTTAEIIKELLMEEGCIISDEGMKQLGCNVMIGYKGKIYQLNTDFFLCEFEEPYNSIGSGGAYALGSLYSNIKSNDKNPVDIIKESIECASYFRGDVGGKIIIMCEDGKEWIF